MRKTKKSMLESIPSRYKVFDNGDKTYTLYDYEGVGKSDYMATFSLDYPKGKFIYNDEPFETFEDMLNSVNEHNASLPYPARFYDPYIRKSYFTELVISDYLKKLGFTQDLESYDNGFSIYDQYKNKIFSLGFEVVEDTESGMIFRYIGGSSMIRSKFETVDEAIASVNRMVLDLYVNASRINEALSNMTERRSDSFDKVSVDNNLNVVIEDQKKSLIEALEKELKRLKVE